MPILTDMTEQILSHLPEDFPWREDIHWFDCVDSTNTRAKALASAGASHGTVLVAGTQTGGRGRMGRTFESPKDTGIYLSVILRPNCSPQEIMHLTCAAGVAVCKATETFCGLRVDLKWVNDFVIGKKKLGGILTELAIDSKTGKVDYAVIGVGINCNAVPSEVQEIATSLSEALGHPTDKDSFTAAVLVSLEKMSRSLLTQKDMLIAQYRRNCITLGKEIRLLQGDTVRCGTAVDIDPQGGLIVSYDDGALEAVHSGEVSVRGMYGYL